MFTWLCYQLIHSRVVSRQLSLFPMAINIQGNLKIIRNTYYTSTRKGSQSRQNRRTSAQNHSFAKHRSDTQAPVLRTSARNYHSAIRQHRAAAQAPFFSVAQQHFNRAWIPSPAEDPIYWEKVLTLPGVLFQFLTPTCNLHARSTTCDMIWRIINHFKPDHHIPSRTSKPKMIEIFLNKIVAGYGAYYGVW